MGASTSEDVLNMSDDDFMKSLPAMTGSSDTSEEEVQPAKTDEVVEEPVKTDPPATTEEPVKDEEPAKDTVVEEPKVDDKVVDPNAKPEEVKPELDANGKPVVKTDAPEADKTPINYEEAYNEIMKPFKANGKMIELRNPQEAIKLMQQGANYTRKVQELLPYKKVVTMLEKNNLLDENKLSFYIDLENKNPDAIRKLIKDSGIDPLDLNTDDATAYQPSNHSVTDEEVNFKSVMEELNSTPEGHETLVVVNTTWDQASKDALWKEPKILETINEHRTSGFYDKITSEIERHKMLGNIDPNVSFLAAYHHVAQAYVQSLQAAEGKVPETQTPQPVAVRPATPKSAVANDEKARAAAATKASPSKVETKVNPLAMADDDFMKLMDKRL